MRNIFLLLLTAFSWLSGSSQKPETVYLNPADSTANLYIVVRPPKTPPSGFLFLIPGMFQKPADVLVQTDLALRAAQKGLLTIIPTFKTGISSLGFDSVTQASFRDMLMEVTVRYQLQGKPFYIGGFSIGGTCAIKYAELATKNNYPVKPSALFAIDAPLDFERMYLTSLGERFNGPGKELSAENAYMVKRYEKEFGGSPVDARHLYFEQSPYSYNDTSLQAIRSLVSLPIRLYTEPDIDFTLEQGGDYWSMNAFDFAALTNDLRRLGSKKIALVTTTNKGYRKPGNERHPHSWSIAEPDDLLNWLLMQK